MGANIGYIY